MGLALVLKALLLLQLTQLLLCSFAVSAPVLPQVSPLYHAVSPVKQPTPPPSHHHHHNHRRPHPPTKPPTYPPKAPTPAPPKPPVQPPTKPPTTKPPTYPPPKPPVHSPTKPPTTKPPTYPPPKSPVHPPTTKPPTTKPPTYPPPKSPVHPPTTKPPVHSPTKPPTTKPPTYQPPKSPFHPPTTKPPIKPPTKPPSSPVQPPTYPRPQFSNVSVQGVVYCKSCKYAGVDTLLGAKPVLGATVRLACKDSKNNLTLQFTTDKNGYFFLIAPNTIYNFSLRHCVVSLVTSPLKSCSTPSNLNGGLKGAPLKPENSSTSKKLPYVLYSVGPFAFEPKCH